MGTRLGGAVSAALLAALAVGAAKDERSASDVTLRRDVPANPHWTSQGCAVCHEHDMEGFKPVPRGQVDVLCLSCHDGRIASRDRHPVGRTFASDQVENRANWPLVRDRLSCVTCHTFTDHCRPTPVRRADNPRFLRGDGSGGATFCATCHTAATAQRHNPHRMIGEGGAVIESSCGFCHGVAVAWGDGAGRIGRPGLHADELTLCGACHMRHVDFFEPGHTGALVAPAMLAALRRATGNGPTTSGEVPAVNPPGEKAEPTSHAGLALPLDSGGRVTCSTCHNPHESGVFPRGSPLASGAMNWPRLAGTPVPTRVGGADLCRACHSGTMDGAPAGRGGRADAWAP